MLTILFSIIAAIFILFAFTIDDPIRGVTLFLLAVVMMYVAINVDTDFNPKQKIKEVKASEVLIDTIYTINGADTCVIYNIKYKEV